MITLVREGHQTLKPVDRMARFWPCALLLPLFGGMLTSSASRGRHNKSVTQTEWVEPCHPVQGHHLCACGMEPTHKLGNLCSDSDIITDENVCESSSGKHGELTSVRTLQRQSRCAYMTNFHLCTRCDWYILVSNFQTCLSCSKWRIPMHRTQIRSY